jgi:integrase
VDGKRLASDPQDDSREARREFELEHNPVDGVKLFDMSKHEVHPEEDPNTLEREQIPKFLALTERFYPQHYAMAVFGFATGLRGTNIRPIRIKGPKADLNWQTAICYVRRGAGRMGGIYDTTKQKETVSDNATAESARGPSLARGDPNPSGPSSGQRVLVPL